MAQWREHLRGGHKKAADEGEVVSQAAASSSSNCYDLPCGMAFLRRWTLFKFVPFCPTFLADVKQQPATGGGDVDVDVEVAGVTVEMRSLE